MEGVYIIFNACGGAGGGTGKFLCFSLRFWVDVCGIMTAVT